MGPARKLGQTAQEPRGPDPRFPHPPSSSSSSSCAWTSLLHLLLLPHSSSCSCAQHKRLLLSSFIYFLLGSLENHSSFHVPCFFACTFALIEKEEEKERGRVSFVEYRHDRVREARANKQLCGAREKYFAVPLQPIGLTSWLPKEGIHPKGIHPKDTHPSNLMGIPLKVCNAPDSSMFCWVNVSRLSSHRETDRQTDRGREGIFQWFLTSVAVSSWLCWLILGEEG